MITDQLTDIRISVPKLATITSHLINEGLTAITDLLRFKYDVLWSLGDQERDKICSLLFFMSC